MTTLVSQAEYARRLGVSKAAVSQWKKAGRLVLHGEQIDVEASDAALKKYRREGLPAVNPVVATVKRGRPTVKQASRLNTELNDGTMSLTIGEIIRRLKKLDHTKSFDWSEEAQEARARIAAECIGWEAIKSDCFDDGHWGGFQLRIPEYIERHGGLHEGAIAGGFGYEMDVFDVLRECREHITLLVDADGEVWRDKSERMTVQLELLPLLAYPFNEHGKPE